MAGALLTIVLVLIAWAAFAVGLASLVLASGRYARDPAREFGSVYASCFLAAFNFATASWCALMALSRMGGV